MSTRARSAIALAGVAVASLATALAAHALLAWVQAAGLIQGDYGEHSHGMVVPTILAAVTMGAVSMLGYLVHVTCRDAGMLPGLARRFARGLGWRSAASIGLIAAAVLVGMERGEQLAAGHLDGLWSAFGGVPAIGLAFVALCGATASALLRAACEWVAGAHDRILRAVTYLLRNPIAAKPALACALPSAVVGGCYIRDASRIYGRRAPPVPR